MTEGGVCVAVTGPSGTCAGNWWRPRTLSPRPRLWHIETVGTRRSGRDTGHSVE